MSTQDRLLSDEELEKWLVQNTDLEDDGENYVVRSFDDDFFKKFNDLINTQKRLYAESEYETRIKTEDFLHRFYRGVERELENYLNSTPEEQENWQ